MLVLVLLRTDVKSLVKRKSKIFPMQTESSRVAQRANSCARFPQLSNSSRLSDSTRTGEQPAVAARGNNGACHEYHRKKHILAPPRKDRRAWDELERNL